MSLLSGSKVPLDETTRLLHPDTSSTTSHDDDSSQSSSSSLYDNGSPTRSYGATVKSDEEEQREPDAVASTAVQAEYSNGFIARVVVALLVGKLGECLVADRELQLICYIPKKGYLRRAQMPR